MHDNQSTTKGGENYEQRFNEEERARPEPRIYVASLSDYHAGRLHGTWIDAAQEPDEIATEVGAMLASSPTPEAEEYAIHDFEGFGPARLEEYETLESVSALARGIAEHGSAFAHYAATMGSRSAEDLANFDEAYLGHFTNIEEYAENLVDDLGYDDLIERALPGHLHPYVHFDTEGFARDLELSGDVSTSDGDGGIYVFDMRS
jgi:antirestriction protein